MKRILVLSALVGLINSVHAQRSLAEDWPTFRGANRTAISSDKNLLDSWGENGPELLWSAPGAGRGYASPAVSKGRIYTLGDGPSTAKDGDEYLTCFEEATGKQLWISKTGPAWNEGRNISWQGSRSTPTVDGDMVYVITPHGKIVCVKTQDGSVAWKKDLKQDFGGAKGKDGWGYSESPLIDGGALICTPGGGKSTVVALDKKSGELIWTCVRPDDTGAGHSSVVISHVGGRKVYVQNTGCGPMGIDALTGQLLWSYYMTPPTAFIPSPIIKGDYVFSVAGYKLGGALLQQIPGADNSITVKEIYGLKTALGNKHGGVILIGDHLYGGVEDTPTIYCADLMTGEFAWREHGSGERSISIAAADGKLFLRYQNGVVALAKVDPAGFKEISTFTTPDSGDGDKPSWAHPVIANGKLYLREGNTILCYQISKS